MEYLADNLRDVSGLTDVLKNKGECVDVNVAETDLFRPTNNYNCTPEGCDYNFSGQYLENKSAQGADLILQGYKLKTHYDNIYLSHLNAFNKAQYTQRITLQKNVFIMSILNTIEEGKTSVYVIKYNDVNTADCIDMFADIIAKGLVLLDFTEIPVKIDSYTHFCSCDLKDGCHTCDVNTKSGYFKICWANSLALFNYLNTTFYKHSHTRF